MGHEGEKGWLQGHAWWLQIVYRWPVSGARHWGPMKSEEGGSPAWLAHKTRQMQSLYTIKSEDSAFELALQEEG